MGYIIEQRLLSVIHDLEDAEQCLYGTDIEAALGSIKEAILKLKKAKKAVEGNEINCD